MTGLDRAKVCLSLSAAFLCATLGVAALEVRDMLKDVAFEVHGSTFKLNGVLDAIKDDADYVATGAVGTMGAAGDMMNQAGTALKQVKRTVAKLDPSLDQLHTDLKEGYKVEHDARVSLDNLNKAAIDERFYFERDLPPLMDALKVDVVDLGDTLTAAKTTIADSNLKRMFAASATNLENLQSITGDGKEYVHKLTHPDAKHGFIYGFETTGDVMKHWIPSLF